LNSLSLTYHLKLKAMSSITTELDRENNFVLTDENDKVMAIINVPLNTTDIDNKLSTAISEDTGDKFLYFQTELLINLEASAKTLEFDAFLEDPDDDEYRYLATFFLTRTETY
jgi:hypothetical protein